ncbi:MAG: hypothetical protein AAGE59_31300 [Cyanobacteria bacterium P01_F01_bin.86]
MPLDDFLDEARKLRRQGCDSAQITDTLRQYGATAQEAQEALKALQKEERERGSQGF